MKDLINTRKILGDFGSETIRKAKLELGVTRTRQRRYTKWKKTGKGFQPVGTRLKNFKGRISSSGTLSDSLEYKITKTNKAVIIRFLMESYGVYVDQGRKPGKVARNVLDDYYRKKPIKPRSFVNGRLGGYIKATKSAKKAMDFMIKRKLQYFGYEKTEFFTKPLEEMLEILPPDLRQALINDILIEFDDDSTR